MCVAGDLLRFLPHLSRLLCSAGPEERHQGLVIGLYALHDLARALAVVHPRRIAHLDIKLGNLVLMLLPNGRWTLQLANWGLATKIPLGCWKCDTDVERGSPGYRGHEIEIDLALPSKHTYFCTASDVYSFGNVVLALFGGIMGVGHWELAVRHFMQQCASHRIASDLTCQLTLRTDRFQIF